MNWRVWLAIIVKELRQLRRDRLTFGDDHRHSDDPAAAVRLRDQHGRAPPAKPRCSTKRTTARSRELVAAMATTQVMNFGRRVQSRQELDALLREGEISAALILPHDFERTPRAARPRSRADRRRRQRAGDPSRGAPTRGVCRSTDKAGRTPSAIVEVVNFYNPERRSAVNTVPGLIGVILTMTMVLFTAVAIVRERERGNIEMLIATRVAASN
jgi:ABC-2 type transport system permease protein